MALSFTHTTKRIGVPQVDAQPLTMQVLINTIREEEASERGIAYDQIADATGKDTLSGGVMTGITVNLRSTWLIEFTAGSYQALVTDGNLADALSRIYNTGFPQVLINSSAAATVIYGEGGGTAPTAAQNAAATVEAIRIDFEADPPPSDVRLVNGIAITGTGIPPTIVNGVVTDPGDPWGPVP